MAYAFGTVLLLLLVPSILAVWGFAKLVPLDYSAVSGRAALLAVFYVVYVLLFMLLFLGRKNPHNANDNTSGSALVLEIMKALPENAKAAMILFDGEEKGKKGSRAFAKAHERIRTGVPVINFDCVGNGDHFVVILNKSYSLSEEILRGAFGGLQGVTFARGPKAKCNSDHLSFDQGVGVLACHRAKNGLLYCGRIHTPRDTQVDAQNLVLLREAALRCVKQ